MEKKTAEWFKAEYDEAQSRAKEDRIDAKYLYEIYLEKVKDYLPVMGRWKNEKGMTLDEIRLLLGIGQRAWNVLTKMPTIQRYVGLKGDFIESKLEMDLLSAKYRNADNHKFHETSLKLFHSGFGDKKSIKYDIPDKIEMKITDGRMSDEEIEKKYKSDDTEEIE